MPSSIEDAIRTSLGRLSEMYEALDKLSCFYFFGGMLKLYFNNITVKNFVEYIKLTFS